MKIRFVGAKNIITKSNIPGIDYVINPYIGCQHGCVYCYAEFMKRFTNHKGDIWGNFLDIKQYPFEKIQPEKYNNKTILLSSVTDPYIPLELKYQNTKKILEHLLGTKAIISILTKSKYAMRDINLFKEFDNLEFGISIFSLNENFTRIIEPIASKPMERLDLIKEIHKHGIKTYVFISPFFPQLTDFKKIIEYSVEFTDFFMFENLNFRPYNIHRINNIIKKDYPYLMNIYKEFQNDDENWELIKEDIIHYCENKGIQYSIEFHHGGFSKKKKK
ncbi:MAG: radical SAM protein [Candidatus Lokiarchaeota archaeon]|nr:radical SAM protein [Candidatus Lokiarchaeota archaeon]